MNNAFMDTISLWALPVLLLWILIAGLIKKVPVYE